MPLAQAMTRQCVGKHDVWLALNGCFPETIEDLRDRFRGLIPPERIVTFRLPPQPSRYTGGWQNHAAEVIREHFLANLAPDIVHVSSLFEGQNTEAVTTIGSIPTAVTLYDLIPLLHEDAYLPEADLRRWYFGKIAHLRNAQLWLSISEHTRNEAISTLGLPRDRVVNISAAVADCFTPLTITKARERKLRNRYGLVRPFLMYTGELNVRKNIEGLIEAFAMLPVRRDYQLVIVCSVNDQGRQILMAHAAKFGLDPAELVITGFVPEDDLVTLYNLCHLFVFPSLHEGFGLPALEAMACGAPVIGSNRSSIPEVIGWNDALFDPTRPSAIAAAMAEVLANEAFRQKLRDHGLRQAGLFSWEESARRALAAFEQLEKPMTRGSTLERNEATTGLVAELVAAREAVEAEVKTLRDQFAWLKAELETTQQQVVAAAHRERELAVNNARREQELSAVNANNGELEAATARLEQDLAAVNASNGELAATTARLERDLSAVNADNGELRQNLHVWQETAQQWQATAQQWQASAENRVLELQAVFASRSWRLTTPLRWLGNLGRHRVRP